MYQLSISIANNKMQWLPPRDSLLKSIKKFDAVFADNTVDDRYYLCFGCEDANASILRQRVLDYLIELYLTNVKKEYIKKSIRVQIEYFDILLSILTSFDRESEEKLLKKSLVLTDMFSIDGYFYFRLQDLIGRWDEICALTKENAFFFANKDNLLELIRFLMSTIRPKIDKVVVGKGKEMQFEVCNANKKTIKKFDDAKELMLWLIDVAPLEISLVGDILPSEQNTLLTNIFEEKFSGGNIIIPSLIDNNR